MIEMGRHCLFGWLAGDTRTGLKVLANGGTGQCGRWAYGFLAWLGGRFPDLGFCRHRRGYRVEPCPWVCFALYCGFWYEDGFDLQLSFGTV